jgi:uroporphyrinogen-III synthase
LAGNGIAVDELVVYETGVMESFEEDLKAVLEETEISTASCGVRWVVVFSPTGCEVVLRSLRLLDLGERAQREKLDRRRTLVATIGPTTRDFLREKFGFEPDVCATSPSAEGLGDSILRFLENELVVGTEEIDGSSL